MYGCVCDDFLGLVAVQMVSYREKKIESCLKGRMDLL